MIPDLSVICVIVFVLVLSALLDRLLLRPVTRIRSERDGAIRAARDAAQSSEARAQAASSDFEAKTREARADVYRRMDDKRRTALDRRAALVADTRREVEQLMRQASTRVRTQADAARAQLDRDADAVAATIVERVLGRNAP